MFLRPSPFLLLAASTAWFSCLNCVYGEGLDEYERVAEYHARNHTWPPLKEEYTPRTEGWRKLMERRLRQAERVPDRELRYNAYVVTVHSALICPNFTEYGWAVTRAPQFLVDELKESLHEGIAEDTTMTERDMMECIEGPSRPLFIRQDRLNSKVVKTLKPIHEAWAGVKLAGSNAYGLRVYRNESTLGMHLDKTDTHIISSILHVDHDPDSDPWPIVIEDFHGNTHEVALESGDMLLYESTKCFHGRPRKFNGSWYSSIFTHYYPRDWRQRYNVLDVHHRIPPTWADAKPSEEGLEDLVVVETSVKEPQCENSWCGLKDSIKWSGPSEGYVQYGKVMSADRVVRTLDIPPEESMMSDEL